MTDPEWESSRPRLEGTERSAPGREGAPLMEAPRPDVQAQLAQRRQGTIAAWRRDAPREVALVVLLVCLLALLFVVGVAAKDRQFRATGDTDSAAFWMESAQRFRYVRMVAEGGSIPSVDRQMEAPDGYPPWSDTVLQEVFYGYLHRRFGGPETDLATFVRHVTRLISASAVFPIVLLAFALTRRRDAALLAGLAYSSCLAVTERGIGTGLFREDLAVPVLCWHLALLAVWTRRPRAPMALLSGLFLALALLLWKVVHFYVLFLVLFLATAHWLVRERSAPLLTGSCALLGPAALAALLPLSLSYDGFLSSTPFLAGLAVLSGLVGSVLFRKSPMSFWVGLSCAAFMGLRLLLPREVGYDHAWETIFARLHFAFEKPEDPTLLSFHARHYWTGNYESPTLPLLVRTWATFVLAALPGLWVSLRGWSKSRFEAFDVEGPFAAPVPTKLFQGLGASEPLPPLASHFLVWLVLTFTGSYLVFRKLQLLAAIALALAVAVGFASVRRGRPLVRIVVVLLVLVSAAQGWRFVSTADRWLDSGESDPWNPVEVFSASSFDDLAHYLSEATKSGDTVLASFVISPFILTYTDRSTVLHCFFEGEVLDRLQDVIEARFSDEEELWNLSRRMGSDWYIHEAHHLLRSDGRMSQRYVAGRMDWPHDSVLARMQFAPETLKHFELHFENEWFRVFRVLEPEQKPARFSADEPHLMWNRRLFTHLFGDPLAASGGAVTQEGVTPADLLYATLQAERWLERAQALSLGEDRAMSSWAERYLQEAQRIAPYFYRADEALGAYYTHTGSSARALQHDGHAELIRHALAGKREFPSPMLPKSPLKR